VGGRDPNAMRQWFPCQVVVDEGWPGANAPETQLHEEELFRVHKVHGHDLLVLYSKGRLQPCPIFQYSLIHLFECPAPTLEDQKDFICEFLVLGAVLQNIKWVQTACLFPRVGHQFAGHEADKKPPVVGDGPFRIQVEEARCRCRRCHGERN
jgi:hypothetical protein